MFCLAKRLPKGHKHAYFRDVASGNHVRAPTKSDVSGPEFCPEGTKLQSCRYVFHSAGPEGCKAAITGCKQEALSC